MEQGLQCLDRERRRKIIKPSQLAAALLVVGFFTVDCSSLVFAKGRSPAACYESAREATLLNSDTALRLCRAAADTGPVTCFSAAKEQTMLSDDLKILLCQCAAAAATTDCFVRTQKKTNLSDERVINLCRAAATGNTGANCRSR